VNKSFSLLFRNLWYDLYGGAQRAEPPTFRIGRTVIFKRTKGTGFLVTEYLLVSHLRPARDRESDLFPIVDLTMDGGCLYDLAVIFRHVTWNHEEERVGLSSTLVLQYTASRQTHESSHDRSSSAVLRSPFAMPIDR